MSSAMLICLDARQGKGCRGFVYQSQGRMPSRFFLAMFSLFITPPPFWSFPFEPANYHQNTAENDGVDDKTELAISWQQNKCSDC